jgi:hypothetical protein
LALPLSVVPWVLLIGQLDGPIGILRTKLINQKVLILKPLLYGVAFLLTYHETFFLYFIADVFFIFL